MDGRDIGTVVLPDAGLKIFLSASAECRAQRRWRQLQEKGIEEPYADVLRELEQRDYDDTHRAVAPLKAAPDAVHIDTSDLTLDESIDAVCAAIRTRFGVEAKGVKKLHGCQVGRLLLRCQPVGEDGRGNACCRAKLLQPRRAHP